MIALIIAIAMNEGINPNLLLATCMQETHLTNINTLHDGHSTSYGPCQVKKVAAKQIGLGHLDLNQPENSIKVAAKYLKLGDTKCNNQHSGLDFFNTGKCLKIVKNNGYVSKVMAYYKQFEETREKEWYEILSFKQRKIQ